MADRPRLPKNQRHASLTFVLRPIPPFRLDLTVWRRYDKPVAASDGTLMVGEHRLVQIEPQVSL